MAEIEESVPELKARIAEYSKQLSDVEQLIGSDPHNEEYRQLRMDIVEIISLTDDLLKHKQAQDSPHKPHSSGPSSSTTGGGGAALQASFTAGTMCEAKYSEDGVWYKAKITAVLEGGKYHVTYVEYGNEEVVAITDIRPLTDTAKKSHTPHNSALKRPLVPDAIQTIPKSLQILPTDSEEQRAAKKKKIKSIKSANRLKNIDDEGKSKKSAWEKFQNKPKKSVPMSFTGRKKDSIFKSTESGRIGVTGSGKPMTQDTSNLQFKLAVKKGDIYMPSDE